MKRKTDDFYKKEPFLYITIILLVLSAIPLYANDKWNIAGEFLYNPFNNIFNSNYYIIKSNLVFKVKILKNFSFSAEIQADNFELESGEISFNWELFDYLQLLFGKFENKLTLDYYLPKHKSLFASAALTSLYINMLGYLSNSTGLMIYKGYKKNTLPLSYFIHILYLPSQWEMQLDAGFFYHFKGENSYLGLIGCYFPFIAHSFWVGERSETSMHNFTLDFIFNNHENKYLYGMEITFGSNIFDPVNMVEFPEDSQRTYFLSGDLHIGYSFKFDNIEWIPAIRYSILFVEISAMGNMVQEIRLGNCINFRKLIYFFLDTGIDIITKYISHKLYTRYEFVWAINLVIKS